MNPELLKDPTLREVPEKLGYKILPPCILLGAIGRGGMGSVYYGYDVRLKIEQAIKCMSPQADPEIAALAKERFLREAQVGALIRHTNLIGVSGKYEFKGLHYLVMDFVRGETAWDRMRRKQGLGVEEALLIISEACKGIAEMHAKDYVHRDIKPDNIMVAAEGRVRVLDLGLAKKVRGTAEAVPGGTLLGTAVGTPHFMPPEQFENAASVGKAADVWSLGASLYTLLTGELPFTGDLYEIQGKVRSGTLPDPRVARPDIPESIAKLLSYCMAQDPLQRYPDAGVLGAALREMIGARGEAELADPEAARHSPRVDEPESRVVDTIERMLSSDSFDANPEEVVPPATWLEGEGTIPETPIVGGPLGQDAQPTIPRQAPPAPAPAPKRSAMPMLLLLLLLVGGGGAGWYFTLGPGGAAAGGGDQPKGPDPVVHDDGNDPTPDPGPKQPTPRELAQKKLESAREALAGNRYAEARSFCEQADRLAKLDETATLRSEIRSQHAQACENGIRLAESQETPELWAGAHHRVRIHCETDFDRVTIAGRPTTAIEGGHWEAEVVLVAPATELLVSATLQKDGLEISRTLQLSGVTKPPQEFSSFVRCARTAKATTESPYRLAGDTLPEHRDWIRSLSAKRSDGVEVEFTLDAEGRFSGDLELEEGLNRFTLVAALRVPQGPSYRCEQPFEIRRDRPLPQPVARRLADATHFTQPASPRLALSRDGDALKLELCGLRRGDQPCPALTVARFEGCDDILVGEQPVSADAEGGYDLGDLSGQRHVALQIVGRRREPLALSSPITLDVECDATRPKLNVARDRTRLAAQALSAYIRQVPQEFALEAEDKGSGVATVLFDGKAARADEERKRWIGALSEKAVESGAKTLDCVVRVDDRVGNVQEEKLTIDLAEQRRQWRERLGLGADATGIIVMPALLLDGVPKLPEPRNVRPWDDPHGKSERDPVQVDPLSWWIQEEIIGHLEYHKKNGPLKSATIVSPEATREIALSFLGEDSLRGVFSRRDIAARLAGVLSVRYIVTARVKRLRLEPNGGPRGETGLDCDIIVEVLEIRGRSLQMVKRETLSPRSGYITRNAKDIFGSDAREAAAGMALSNRADLNALDHERLRKWDHPIILALTRPPK